METRIDRITPQPLIKARKVRKSSDEHLAEMIARMDPFQNISEENADAR